MTKLDCFEFVCGIDHTTFNFLLQQLFRVRAFERGRTDAYGMEDILVEWCALYLRNASTYQVFWAYVVVKKILNIAFVAFSIFCF